MSLFPIVMAAAVCAALQRRRENGRGAHIDASMYEICVQQMRDAILQAQTGVRPERSGNRDSRIFHQGVYAVQGQDQWIAISLPSASDWSRLREFAGLPDAVDADARDSVIAAWSRKQEGGTLMTALQRAGFSAGNVQDIEDLLERDPQLEARRSLIPLEHALLGTFGHMRTPVSFSRSQLQPFRAPSIGEHSLSIARDICGLDAARALQLDSLGVFQ